MGLDDSAWIAVRWVEMIELIRGGFSRSGKVEGEIVVSLSSRMPMTFPPVKRSAEREFMRDGGLVGR